MFNSFKKRLKIVPAKYMLLLTAYRTEGKRYLKDCFRLSDLKEGGVNPDLK